MKRVAPSRPGGFLTQKKIRFYLEQPAGKETVTPLKEIPYEQERGNPLTVELRHAMLYAVQDQLRDFKANSGEPLLCAFNKDHSTEALVSSHYIRYFDELCDAFLKMFSSLRLPREYDPETGGFITAKDEVFAQQWTSWHKQRANLRILCNACHVLHTNSKYKINVKKTEKIATPSPLSLNEALQPYRGKKKLAHSWLDLTSWGPASNKGNYSRKLGDKQFTLFQRDSKWNYVYDNKFGSEPHESIRQVLNESYQVFGDTIRRFL